MQKFDLTYRELDIFIDEAKYAFKLDLRSGLRSFLKRAVGGFIDDHDLNDVDGLLEHLKDAKNLDAFVRSFVPDKTEFFRDPGLWRFMKDYLSSKSEPLSILEIEASSGEELFTLQILLEMIGKRNNTHVIATQKYEQKLNQLKEAEYSSKKMEATRLNLQRFDGTGKVDQFFSNSGSTVQMDKTLLEGVEFRLFDLDHDRAMGEYDIVFCRNVLCYYDRKKSRTIYKTIADSVKKGGLLILGVQEDLSNSFYARDFQMVNEEFKVYRKL